MKNRILIIILVLFILVGCSSKKDNKVNTSKLDNKNDIVVEEDKNEYIDNNPIKLSLYVDKNRVKEYKSPMKIYTDIVSLECFYTEDDRVIDGKFSDVFNNYYNKYSGIDDYRIGYMIKFSTDTGVISKYIYRPSDVFSYFNYVQTYLYDDIHQSSSWYSHLEDDKYTSDSMITSIKLTASTDIDKVSSDIEVTVFTYTNRDINENNEYMGNSKYSVVIKRGV